MEKTGSVAVVRPALGFPVKKNYAKARSTQVQKVIVSTIAGDGTAGFLDGPALDAKFKSPLDIAVLPGGIIYVADAFNSCIRKIHNGMVTTFAGNGNANITNGNGRDARFKIPSRLTLDARGNLYTLDAADPRIRKIDPAADVYTYAGTNIFGFKDGKAAFAQFGQSFGIVGDRLGNIYIADTQNDSIRKISYTGEVNTIAGIQENGDPNRKIVQFNFVTGIAIDKHDNLFVSDITKIHKITPAGIISTFAGSNLKGFVDGRRDIARFSQMEDIILDDRGNIYVSDGNRIRKITLDGEVSTVAGSSSGYQDGDGISAKFNGPQGLAIDANENIYVADFNNKSIRKISFA